MNRKASGRDIILVVVIGFAMVLAGLFAIKVLTFINDKIQSVNSVPAEAKQTLNVVTTRVPKWIDGAFLLFYVLFMIAGLFLAMQINSNPVFLPISIFYFLFLVFISRVFSVVYSRLVASSALSDAAATLNIIPYVMPRLPLFSFVFGVLIIGVMVVKR